MEKKLFSLPKLSKCGTFIQFNYWNADKWKFERFKKHISKKIPPEKRKKEIGQLLEYWTIKLKNGYNPYVEIKEKVEVIVFIFYLIENLTPYLHFPLFLLLFQQGHNDHHANLFQLYKYQPVLLHGICHQTKPNKK